MALPVALIAAHAADGIVSTWYCCSRSSSGPFVDLSAASSREVRPLAALKSCSPTIRMTGYNEM